MKSHLRMVAKSLGVLLMKLWQLLKRGFTLILRNRKLCQVIVVVMLLMLTWTMGARYGARTVADVETPQQTLEQPEPTIQSEEPQIQEADIIDIAKVLYGYRYNSDRDLEGIAWVVLNRVDNQAEFRHLSTVSDVVNQPSQWMGYDKNNPVLENLYDIAERVLYKYENDGKRLFGREYLYFEWNSEYIVFKTELYDSKTCKTWRSY